MKRCCFCHREGARWQLRVNGKAEILPVHRGCGRTLAVLAPEGQGVKVVPSQELRREWRARDFWKQKFQEAQAKKAQA